MGRSVKKTQRTASKPKGPEQYVVWMNLGSAIEELVFDKDHVVKDWVPLREVSIPERFADKCEELGLKRIRNAK